MRTFTRDDYTLLAAEPKAELDIWLHENGLAGPDRYVEEIIESDAAGKRVIVIAFDGAEDITSGSRSVRVSPRSPLPETVRAHMCREPVAISKLRAENERLRKRIAELEAK